MGIYIHELGHYAACLYLGYESGGIIINLLQSTHTCMFNGMTSDADRWFVLAGGGSLATTVFGAALAAFLVIVRARNTTHLSDFVLFFILVGFIPQFINLVLEAGVNASYNEATRALGAVCGVFLVCYIWYSRLPKHGSGHRLFDPIRRPLV